MRTAILNLKRVWQTFGQACFVPLSRGFIVAIASFLAAASLPAATTVNTLGGGAPSKFYGYKNGVTLSQALFHTPSGLCLDATATQLLVADRDNNAIRILDLAAGKTYTFGIVASNAVNKPIGVAVDSFNNVYVLNRGNGNNGMVVEFNNFGDLIATNAVGLTNAAGITIDVLGDLYVTVNSNKLIEISPFFLTTNVTTVTNITFTSTNIVFVTNVLSFTTGATNVNTIVTVAIPGTSLQGLVAKHNGMIAACDSGRNGILLIDPATGNISTNAGFHGLGDFTPLGTDMASSNSTRLRQPMGVTEAGDGTLVISDYGNNRIKAVVPNGVVTNIAGVSSNYWVKGSGKFPGWADGPVIVPDESGDVESRMPFGVVFAPDGSIYTSEDYYHVIRKITGSGLPQPPPPPPQVPAPAIGWVSFPPPLFTSVFNSGTSFVFNNDVPIVIEGTSGSQTYYTFGPTPAVGSIADPTRLSASAPVGYSDGLFPDDVKLLTVASILPDLTVKAIGEKSDGSPNSPIVQARFQFVVANPLIVGNNAGLFTLADLTAHCSFWYTIDGTDPSNGPPSLFLTTNSPALTNEISLPISTNFVFKVRAFKDNYQPSQIIAAQFSTSNFVPNSISFGFTAGEASSDFVASPGQFFYAPVTLNMLPNQLMYSLQFNLTVTNVSPAPPVSPVFGFQSMLVKPIEGTSPPAYETIPPAMFLGYVTNITYSTNVGYVTNLVGTNVVITPVNVITTNFVGIPVNNPPPTNNNQIIFPYVDQPGAPFLNMVFANTNENLLGIGWLERATLKNLYDTTKQDLIQFSIAHDTLFNQSGGKVILGGYAFQIPPNAVPGQQYQIQIGRPSATSDGIGAPGFSVLIFTPTNGSTGGGTVNSIKLVTVGQRKYIAGDAAPFRWFNAGDFGNTNLDNSDVEQVFQSAIYGIDNPPFGSDFFDSEDSCGNIGVFDGVNGYYTNAFTFLNTAQQNALFDGNDSTIDQIAFGDGILDVCDVYVTFRRSSDPSPIWYRRFWTNGVLVAETAPNVVNRSAPGVRPSVASKTLQPAASFSSPGSITNQPKVTFVAGDIQITPSGQPQYLSVPITANIVGNYPLRMLMLNLSVVPLDGSPALTTPVSFQYNVNLGAPFTTSSSGNGNYSAVWLNNNISGLTGNGVILGNLIITVPANVTSLSSYAIHFDHASASPNGVASFPKQARAGLITLANRSTSSFNDGIPDSWRLRYFLTLNNVLSATNADADGDGMNNLQEYNAGTDPTDPKSVFKNIGYDQPAALQPSDCVISWPSVVGKQYVIERSATIVAPTWTPISTVSGNGGVMEYHDTSGGGVRYYRVQVQ